jgi:hypothetical protein
MERGKYGCSHRFVEFFGRTLICRIYLEFAFMKCDQYNDNDPNDPAKTRWRNFFTTGTFARFDRAQLPYLQNAPSVVRQSGKPENFYFYYESGMDILFIGITEPDHDTVYDPINAAWIASVLSGKSPRAVVVMGHSTLSAQVLSVLDPNIPMLHVRGSTHLYCMRFFDIKNRPNWLEVTVDAFQKSPLLISLVQDDYGDVFFHVEKTTIGCN